MGRGIYLVKNPDDLHRYCSLPTPAYIQEYLPCDRDVRVVIIGDQIAHAYWRIAPANEFRSNIAVGATVSLDPIPQSVLDLALNTARKCQWDDVGIDIIENEGRLYVLEANMKYGKEGFRRAGIDYLKFMEKMIEDGKI
jgi:ribosomal protein S6--L-glutamate ligase